MWEYRLQEIHRNLEWRYQTGALIEEPLVRIPSEWSASRKLRSLPVGPSLGSKTLHSHLSDKSTYRPLDETSFLSKSGHRVNAASTQSRNQSGYACGKRKY